MNIRPVVHGVVRPPIRGYAPNTGGGAPDRALFISAAAVQIGGYFIVIGA